MDVVELGNVTVGRATFEPGWRWSEHVKPVAGTDSCLVPHVGYIISGRLGIAMDDGTEQEFGPDEAFVIPPGHDGWVVGDELVSPWTSPEPMSTPRGERLNLQSRTS